jgi:carboxymethylenebutenolidase
LRGARQRATINRDRNTADGHPMTGTNFKSRRDGFRLSAHHAPARGLRRGGLVLAQEIFGVNANIRALADRFAEAGYETLAPSFFDRIERGFQAGYDEAGTLKGRAAVEKTPWDQVRDDLQDAIDALHPPVFVIGFCWGGTAAWVAAGECDGVAAAIGCYGRLITTRLDHAPIAPTLLMYGETDPLIPAEDVARVRAAHPSVPVKVYPAGHGFFSDRGHDHDPSVAAAAWQDAMAFFARHG